MNGKNNYRVLVLTDWVNNIKNNHRASGTIVI